MPLVSLNRRIALVVTALLLVVVWKVAMGASRSVVIIEFGQAPELLEGAEVLVDGEVVGTLRRMGARTQTGFELVDGRHTVEVRREGWGSEPLEVTGGFGGERVLLLAEPGERYGTDGAERVIVLMR